jgi:hypothetical protein
MEAPRAMRRRGSQHSLDSLFTEDGEVASLTPRPPLSPKLCRHHGPMVLLER